MGKSPSDIRRIARKLLLDNVNEELETREKELETREKKWTSKKQAVEYCELKAGEPARIECDELRIECDELEKKYNALRDQRKQELKVWRQSSKVPDLNAAILAALSDSQRNVKLHVDSYGQDLFRGLEEKLQEANVTSTDMEDDDVPDMTSLAGSLCTVADEERLGTVLAAQRGEAELRRKEEEERKERERLEKLNREEEEARAVAEARRLEEAARKEREEELRRKEEEARRKEEVRLRQALAEALAAVLAEEKDAEPAKVSTVAAAGGERSAVPPESVRSFSDVNENTPFLSTATESATDSVQAADDEVGVRCCFCFWRKIKKANNIDQTAQHTLMHK